MTDTRLPYLPDDGVDLLDSIADTILITAGPSSWEDFPKSSIPADDEAMLAIAVFRNLIRQTISRATVDSSSGEDQERWLRLLHRMLDSREVVFRPRIDIEGEGLLLNGNLPGLWVHLGHGDYKDGESSISKSDDEYGDYIPVSDVIAHLEGGEGILWLAVMPVCHGRRIAVDLENHEKVLKSWGSTRLNPAVCWDELILFASEVETIINSLDEFRS